MSPTEPATGPRCARKVRRALWTLFGVALVGVVALAAINAYILLSARGKTKTVETASHAQVAIVLGAQVTPTGLSPMLEDRVVRGAQLYKAGKVDKIIVSGDNGQRSYNEVLPMRRAMQRLGVPARDIFMDHAGFSTRASMIRARKVFGVKTAIVVTQRFHMKRALFLAGRAGIDAVGVTSDIQPYGVRGRVSIVREMPARVKAFGETLLGTPVLLGPPIPIDGDGRVSWGPESDFDAGDLRGGTRSRSERSERLRADLGANAGRARLLAGAGVLVQRAALDRLVDLGSQRLEFRVGGFRVGRGLESAKVRLDRRRVAAVLVPFAGCAENSFLL